MANARMRIAIAGTNTLALMMAHFVVTETSHQLVVLSRQVSTAHFLSEVALSWC
jgi:fucose 4-O-acetylase-like acetyltransferase